jgi:hypothetical protein
MNPHVHAAVLSIAALWIARPCTAQDGAPPDKSVYHIGNPTPRARMRELTTDRPDTTESAFTLDAGHVQLEMSFAEFTRDRPSHGGRTDHLVIAPLNVRLGLLNSTEVQLMFDPYIRERVNGGDDAGGVGDLTLRIKQNLWGNDGGATALAVMPFIGFPSGHHEVRRGALEGGLIVPFAAELPGEFSLGLMAELDILHDSAADEHVAELVHTITVGRTLAGALGGYAEYVGVEPLSLAAPYRASASFGLTYGLSPDVQLDAGVVVGLNEAAEDLTLFAGMAIRR